MKESYREGIANHPGPEPCEGSSNAALGVSAGWVLSSEIGCFGEPTASDSTEGNNAQTRKRERGAAPRSRRPHACRETLCARTGRPRCRPQAVCGPGGEGDEP